jgi:hypothetical protein
MGTGPEPIGRPRSCIERIVKDSKVEYVIVTIVHTVTYDTVTHAHVRAMRMAH